MPKRANLSAVKTPSERGPVGAWAYEARTDLALSVEQVAERIAERGQAVRPATIRGIESGTKKPSARLLRLMGQVLESSPPGRTEEPPPDADVARAIRDQTAVMQALVDELREARLDRDRLQRTEDQVDGLKALVGSLAVQLQIEQALTARLARHVQLDPAGSEAS